ncbi:MAG TPA: hypothetical protein VHS09_13385 [Polyangiaceae bacterium]|jgi:hypothetical protein|nr:hypothetical protein [Polyangiaceae bacterium]
MSSESNGRKPDSQEPGPPSGTSSRVSARAPSAWGATRDALAAVHNLDALLRSDSVRHRTILDLLPELRAGAGVLRDAFERASAGTELAGRAARDVGDYGGDRAVELARLLDATAAADDDREALAGRARTLACELEAAADLLALLERAADPAPTDVDVDRVVRETLRLSGTRRGDELAVCFDEASPDCTLHADPYVVGPLLTLLIASVHAGGVGDVAVRARCTDDRATFLIEAAAAGDTSCPRLAMQVLPAVPPTGVVAARVAEQLGATLELAPHRGSLTLPCAAG